jgi:lysophospholipase L1-like esterase
LPPEVDGRLVFSFGVNDTTIEDGRTRVVFADSLRNTREILNAATAAYPVLMVGPPPIADAHQNERIARLSDAMAEVCRELSVPYLAVYAALTASDVWMRESAGNDGAHPRAAGYAAFAALVEAWPAWQAWLST